VGFIVFPELPIGHGDGDSLCEEKGGVRLGSDCE
jgi:hypothetical protein